jgi:uncharacterized protein (DUF2235 family)
MPKNIVILCDGTGNEFGDRNSNVVKLRQALVRDVRQAIYYHPGVGTMGAMNALTTAGKVWTKVRGLAFGYGLSENIADAYRFLMLNFQREDQVYIFGFSRGAYTARALCGMLRMFGLLAPGNEGLIPYALRLFKRHDGWWARLTGRESKFAIAAGFRETFCIDCAPHFLGVWDTVSSVGWILDPIGLKPGSLPYTKDLALVGKVRHAVSIDERRAFFRQNLVAQGPDRDVKEVWFAGVHSDVGGSYPEAESGLSKITLGWIAREAVAAGLMIDGSKMSNILGGDEEHAEPHPGAMMHNSLTPLWWLGEIWPKSRRRGPLQPGERRPLLPPLPKMNLFRRRTIPEGACLHESVEMRRKLVPGYLPRNLPESYSVERDGSTAGCVRQLGVGEHMDFVVLARAKWNATPLWVSKGERHRFAASGMWNDASIRIGPGGYPSPSLGFRLAEPFRRASKANWFALIGTIQQKGPAFTIGDGAEIEMPADGLLYCFANDLPSFYFNNSGHVNVVVTRLS